MKVKQDKYTKAGGRQWKDHSYIDSEGGRAMDDNTLFYKVFWNNCDLVEESLKE